MISVLIITLNEERNLAACLESVSWSDDILVLDSGSSDGTVALARNAGVRVMQHPFASFAAQRNFGLQEGGLRNEWVLHLDADERVSVELADELRRVVSATDFDGFRVASKLIYEGQWLRRAGMYPTYQVRLGRRDCLSFEQVGHGQRETLAPDRIGTLRNALVHEAFSKGVSDWIARHDRYCCDEAVYARQLLAARARKWTDLVSAGDPVQRRRALKELSYRLPLRPLFRFLYVYLGRLGVLDGRFGLRYCVLLAVYEYKIGLKLRELLRRDAVLSD